MVFPCLQTKIIKVYSQKKHCAAKCFISETWGDNDQQLHWTLHILIGVNATRDAGDASLAIAYLVSRRQNVLYPPKVCQNCCQLPAELMRTVQPAFAVQARDSPTESDSPCFARATTLSATLCTFRLCLHIWINAQWASVTYFLLGQLIPPMFNNRWRRCSSHMKDVTSVSYKNSYHHMNSTSFSLSSDPIWLPSSGLCCISQRTHLERRLWSSVSDYRQLYACPVKYLLN